MKAIILLGAPGAGKGTIAEGIRKALGHIHISTGDMLREAVRQGTELGRQAETFMKRGELVPDEIIIQMVEDRVAPGGAKDVFLFDGFPRTLEQARLLNEALSKRAGRVERVFYLDTPRRILISRLAGRRICRKCGAVYHVVNIPPRTEGVCDKCGGELCQRPDDREATIANRLEVYVRQTAALIAFYQGEGVLVRIDAGRPYEETLADILRRLQAAGAI
jgi:adenylate kinase